jgi:hypothetical protein
MPRKYRQRKRTSLGMHAFRSCITNGTSIFAIKSLDMDTPSSSMTQASNVPVQRALAQLLR